MEEWFKKLRYRIAYFIAPDWIDDLEERFSIFLCEQTGGRMSNCYYTSEEMRSVANDFQNDICEDCEYYLQVIKEQSNGVDLITSKQYETEIERLKAQIAVYEGWVERDGK